MKRQTKIPGTQYPWFIGHIQEYPNYETQGETLEELKTNLMDIYQDISMGCEFVRHSGNHDWYKNPKTGEQQPGRHTQLHVIIT